MSHLHWEVDLNANNIVIVTLASQANVKVMDNDNYNKYMTGQRHTFYGGGAKVSPVRVKPPHSGHWHVVVDLGGYSGRIEASVAVA